MSDKLREQISALADDHLPQGEHELLLRRFAVDKALLACWERYHLIGEAMRKNLPQTDTRRLADRVMAEIRPETVVVEVEKAGPAFLLSRALAGFVVAASVAVIAVLGLRHDTRMQQTAAAPAEIVPAGAGLPQEPLSYGFVNGASWEGTASQVQASLRSYMVNHDVIVGSMAREALPAAAYVRTTKDQPAEPKTEADQDSSPRQP
ncbi:MAG TPA: sigma-E factor negative regulatory protein [Gammaproteobacteria bacterium]|nr:sigma-E factor negative regulatory protein [Gammaproteobacteria bacterium]